MTQGELDKGPSRGAEGGAGGGKFPLGACLLPRPRGLQPATDKNDAASALI